VGVRIVVVDDDPNVCDVLRLYLEKQNFEVLCMGNGADFFNYFGQTNIDLLILDLMLPDTDGFAVCQKVRKESSVPIIILSARGEEYDRIRGLDTGADDYVGKPFSPLELMSRVNALLRRVSLDKRTGLSGPGQDDVTFPGLDIDLASRMVRVNGDYVRVTTREFDILSLLVRERGNVVSRDKIMNNVWGNDADVSNRTIDVHIKWLRDKLSHNNNNYQYLHTVYGIGYKFEVKAGSGTGKWDH